MCGNAVGGVVMMALAGLTVVGLVTPYNAS
jgi:hypothetical protein